MDGDCEPSASRGDEYDRKGGGELRMVDRDSHHFTESHSLGAASQGQPEHEEDADLGAEIERDSGEVQRGAGEAKYGDDEAL